MPRTFPPDDGHATSRLVAAGACALQAVVVAGFCVFYLVELALGRQSRTDVVLTSSALMLLAALGLGLLARAWRRGEDWPRVPTIVWDVLLLPVAWSLLQARQWVVAVLVGAVALVTIAAAVSVRPREDRVV